MPGYDPKSKIKMRCWYRAYAPDGTDKGIVQLDNNAVERYKAKGWTFKRARYGQDS